MNMSSKASKHSDHFKSAFYFYLQEKYDEAKEENPDLDLNDLTADCEDKWKEMDEESKRPYKELAQQNKKREKINQARDLLAKNIYGSGETQSVEDPSLAIVEESLNTKYDALVTKLNAVILDFKSEVLKLKGEAMRNKCPSVAERCDELASRY